VLDCIPKYTIILVNDYERNENVLLECKDHVIVTLDCDFLACNSVQFGKSI
jgi:hypothetical protein